MTKSDSPCSIDAVEIRELVMKVRTIPTPAAGMEAKYVLMNSENGELYGSGTFNTWSDTTTTKLNELLISMEHDINSIVFHEPTIPSVQENPKLPEDAIPEL